MFSYHINVISSHCKASYQSFPLNGNLKLLKIPVKQQFSYSSFIRFTHSFFLSSFFLFCMTRNCLRRRKTRVLFRPHLDIDGSTVRSTGLSLISLNSLDDVDNVSEPTILSSSPLSDTKLKFLHAVESLSPCLIRSC